MKVAVAIDSMKGSLSSPEAGAAAALGIRRVFPDAQVAVHSIADGGEGTCEAILARKGGVRKTLSVCEACGFSACFPILRDVSSRAEAMETERARANLSAAVEQAFRLIRTFR